MVKFWKGRIYVKVCMVTSEILWEKGHKLSFYEAEICSSKKEHMCYLSQSWRKINKQYAAMKWGTSCSMSSTCWIKYYKNTYVICVCVCVWVYGSVLSVHKLPMNSKFTLNQNEKMVPQIAYSISVLGDVPRNIELLMLFLLQSCYCQTSALRIISHRSFSQNCKITSF